MHQAVVGGGIVAGELDIKILNAQLTRNTELIGKMSPFVQIEIGAQMRKTGTNRKGGKKPDFNGEILRFKITSETQMKLIVYDEEKMKAKHDLVGDAIVFLNKVCSGELKKQSVEILHKGKSAGTVNIEFDFMTKLGQNVGNKLLAGMGLSGINQQQQQQQPNQMMSKPVPPPMGANFPMGGMQPPVMGMQQQPVMGMQQQPVMGMQPQPAMGYGMMAQNVGQGVMNTYGQGIAQYQQQMGQAPMGMAVGGVGMPPQQMGQMQQPMGAPMGQPMGGYNPQMQQQQPMGGQQQMGYNPQMQQNMYGQQQQQPQMPPGQVTYNMYDPMQNNK